MKTVVDKVAHPLDRSMDRFFSNHIGFRNKQKQVYSHVNTLVFYLQSFFHYNFRSSFSSNHFRGNNSFFPLTLGKGISVKWQVSISV
jgi:hypothetical protein